MCPIVVMLTPPDRGYFGALVVGAFYFFVFELGTRLIRQGFPKGGVVLTIFSQVASSALICALGGVFAVFIARLFT
jgi:hypothetical protein